MQTRPSWQSHLEPAIFATDEKAPRLTWLIGAPKFDISARGSEASADIGTSSGLLWGRRFERVRGLGRLGRFAGVERCRPPGSRSRDLEISSGFYRCLAPCLAAPRDKRPAFRRVPAMKLIARRRRGDSGHRSALCCSGNFVCPRG